MDAWKKSVRSAGKNHVHKIPLVLGGGILGLGGGGKCRFYFHGREDFSDFLRGRFFYTPHPLTPENTLLGVGGVYKGRAYKIPAAWGLRIYTPTPLP